MLGFEEKKIQSLHLAHFPLKKGQHTEVTELCTRWWEII